MKQSRNSPCQCGSGRKAKRCCLLKQAQDTQTKVQRRNARWQKRFDRLGAETDSDNAPGPSHGMPWILRPSGNPWMALRAGGIALTQESPERYNTNTNTDL